MKLPWTILTCGSDGDIRVWDGFQDEDSVEFSASDSCFGLICHEDKVIVGTDSHTVEMFELPKGKKMGTKAKFTSTVNHVDISKDGKILVAGSGDTTIQVIKMDDTSSLPKKIQAHSGPVLSVCIDPLQQYFASAGGDGVVCIWVLAYSSVPNLVKRWEKIIPVCTDISLSSTLCRMAWHPDAGKCLAIPNHENKVVLYSRDKWERTRVFHSKELTKIVSVVKFSSCGKYIAAGGSDGSILVWNAENSGLLFNYSSEHAVTGLIFNQLNSTELYYVDTRGRFYWLSDLFLSGTNVVATEKSGSENDVGDGEDDAFDDGMDGLLFGEDDNENEISISRIKAEVGFIDDEYVGVDKATRGLQKSALGGDDDTGSNISVDDAESLHSSRPQVLVQTVNPFTDPQGAFQPSSSPVHLEHRFMVWNNVGIIRSYGDEDNEAIDVEFHDASFHQAIHLRNQFDYTMGTLSNEAVVLACDKATKEYPSKLFCFNFGAWDSSKEWIIDMPKGEVVWAIGTGSGWIAVATSLNRIRLFTTGGTQSFVYELPGEVVSVSGFESILFVTYHQGVGVHGSQSISYSLLRVKNYKLHSLVLNAPLPLTPKASLSWIGFTDEGTPLFSDTKETVRILNGQLWTPFCPMKELLSGQGDHFWVVGASETGQNVRAIKCKGAKYPSALPRPSIMLLDAKIPLCELDKEKSQMEDMLLRSFLLSTVTKKMDKKGFDIEEYKEKAEKDIRETLLNLCVLSCKGKRDFRAAEYISLMPTSHAVQVAVKYASKLRRNGLTDRLTAIGRKKMEEIDSEDEDDFEATTRTVVISNSTRFNGNTTNGEYPSSQDLFAEYDSKEDASFSGDVSRRKSVTEENPLMKRQIQEIRDILCPLPVKRNPFKKGGPNRDKEDSQSQGEGSSSVEAGKGLAFIDAWKKPPEKPTATEQFNPKHPQSKRGAAKKNAEKNSTVNANKDKKKQTTLFDMRGKKPKELSGSNPQSTVTNLNEDSNSNTMDAVPGALYSGRTNENDSIKEPMFEGDPDVGAKRKRTAAEAEDEAVPVDNEKKAKFASKLSAFVKN